LLVRAVELADRTGLLLPHGVRERCTAEARPPVAVGLAAQPAAGSLGPDEEAYLARRAALAEAALRQRGPELAVLAGRTGVRGWVLLAIAALAFVIGFISHPASADKRLNLLAFPVLGLVAWNCCVYLLLLLHALRGRRVRPGGGPLVAWIAHSLTRIRLPGLSPAMDAPGQARAAVVTAAASRFLRDWIGQQAPLAVAEARALLHGCALLLALGMAAGLVYHGLYLEYRAGWESTFLGAGAVEVILRILLGPAASLTQISVPDAAGIAALRFRPGFEGENAARWIWLYLAATGIYVVAPRALLLAWSGFRASRLRHSFFSPRRDDRYFHRLLQAGRGTGELAAILWHGVEPTAELRGRVRELLRDELGGQVTLEFLDPIAYGEEASFLRELAPQPGRERFVVVFSLAATPEEEVHGALLGHLEAAHPEGEAVAPLVLLDAAPLGRFAADEGFRSHYEQRLRSWQRFAEAHNAACRVLEPPA
jgi:hypothetical protein